MTSLSEGVRYVHVVTVSGPYSAGMEVIVVFKPLSIFPTLLESVFVAVVVG